MSRAQGMLPDRENVYPNAMSTWPKLAYLAKTFQKIALNNYHPVRHFVPYPTIMRLALTLIGEVLGILGADSAG